MADNAPETGKGELGTAATSSYSTRFDAKQRALIEEAAKIADCTPAKLIRDAAVGRAVDLVNGAAGANDLKILARELVTHVLNPRLQIFKSCEFTAELTPSVVGYSKEMVSLRPTNEHDPYHAEGVQVIRPSGHVLDQIKLALATSGTEFVRMVLAEWDGGEGKGAEYRPKLSASDVLGGESE